MSQTVILIDGGGAEIVNLHESNNETTVHVRPKHYRDAIAQVWGGMEKGAKGIRINFCIGDLPVRTLLKACFDDQIYLQFDLVDAVDSIIREHRDPNRDVDDGWTKEGVISMAEQFEGFAKRLRKAAR